MWVLCIFLFMEKKSCFLRIDLFLWVNNLMVEEQLSAPGLKYATNTLLDSAYGLLEQIKA